MTLSLLLQWWNLVYVLPFLLAVIYLGLYVFTGITFGDADADVDVDADMDAGVHADVDSEVHIEAHVVEADGDADVDADADADHDTELSGHGTALAHATTVHGPGGEAEPSALMGLLTLLGVGRIPMSLLLMILLLVLGAGGFMLNQVLVAWIGPHWFLGWITMPVAAAVALAVGALASRLIGKVIGSGDNVRCRRQDLVGTAGEAMFDIDNVFGMVSVHSAQGNLFQVPCRTQAGEPRIPKGSRVVLFEYDREKGVFHVAPFAA